MSEFSNPIIIIDGEPQQVQGILSVEESQQCDDCGKVRELRPYGPRGSVVCFECAMKDEAEAERQMSKAIARGEQRRQRRSTMLNILALKQGLVERYEVQGHTITYAKMVADGAILRCDSCLLSVELEVTEAGGWSLSNRHLDKECGG